jgi:hypothetical protein
MSTEFSKNLQFKTKSCKSVQREQNFFGAGGETDGHDGNNSRFSQRC